MPDYVPTDDLIGWWPFNGNANDESGNGNDGMANGATLTPDRYDQNDKAYAFDGASSFLQLGPSPFLALDGLDGSDFTASFWFRPNSTGTLFMNFGWGVHSYYDGSTVVYGQVGIWPDNNWYYLNSGNIINPNSWHHVVITKNGQDQAVYLDGAMPTTISSQPCGFGDQVYIGGNPMDNNGWFDGEMDDIGIWGRALEQQEIEGLFNSNSSTHSCGATNVHNSGIQYGTMTDQDGNHYKSVQIGEQTWMAENLMVDHFRNGDLIPEVPASGGTWNSTSSPASCWFNDDRAAFACPYGKMYNWYVAGDSRNVCPTGWRVPSSADFETLVNTLGASAGGKMKSQGIQYWTGGNLGGSNASGFSGLPAGTRWQDSFVELGILAHYWTSTTDTDGQVNSTLVRLHYDGTGLDFFTWDNRRGQAIRCLQTNISTGAEDRSEIKKVLRIHPNPSSGRFEIQIDLAGAVSLVVTDALGRVLHNEEFQGSSTKITHSLDLSRLAKGNYMLMVRNADATVSQQVVVE